LCDRPVLFRIRTYFKKQDFCGKCAIKVFFLFAGTAGSPYYQQLLPYFRIKIYGKRFFPKTGRSEGSSLAAGIFLGPGNLAATFKGGHL